jgi:hypothetical protein
MVENINVIECAANWAVRTLVPFRRRKYLNVF